ncbi:MAG: alpha/beta fold hydrolase [Pseudomonadota bacterium]|nr:alpha/beta fold hydrolase [Pseudomonadota bacterium]
MLADRYDLVIYDQRNHGQNPRHRLASHRLSKFVFDMEEIFHGIKRGFGEKPAIGVFHSVSGVTAIRHALEYGKRWQALILFDPALVPGPGRPENEVGRKFELKLVEWAKQRPDKFESPEELVQQFANARTLKRWVPGARELMAQATLHEERQTGKWVLNCPGAAESQIYKDNSECHLTEFMNQIPVSVKLICADPDQPDALAPSKVGRAINAEFGLNYNAVKNTSHLLQIEKPHECALLVGSFIEKQLAKEVER